MGIIVDPNSDHNAEDNYALVLGGLVQNVIVASYNFVHANLLSSYDYLVDITVGGQTAGAGYSYDPGNDTFAPPVETPPLADANVELSNLSSVALNADLIYGAGLSGAIKTPNASSGVSGNLSLITGSASSAASRSGNIALLTGNNSNNADNSATGGIVMSTGSMSGTGQTMVSGAIQISTGSTPDANANASGSMILSTGVSGYQSGDILISTGDGSVSNDAYSGQVSIVSGAVTGTAQSGNIELIIGAADDISLAGRIKMIGATQIGADSTTLKHYLNSALGVNASGALTMTNAPAGVSGNPAGFIKININGVDSYLPFWQ